MKKHYESATSFLRRKHPVVKAVLDYSFGLISKEIRFIVTMLVVSGAFTFNSCRHEKLVEKVNQDAATLTNVIEYIAP